MPENLGNSPSSTARYWPPRLTQEVVDRLMTYIDHQALTTDANSKDLPELVRDKCLFYTSIATSLRVSEVLALDVDSLTFNIHPQHSGLNKPFIFANVLKSGTRSPIRSVCIVTPLAECLRAYIEAARPQLLSRGCSPTRALFLSNSGKRLTTEDYRRTFAGRLKNAGLELSDSFSNDASGHSVEGK